MKKSIFIFAVLASLVLGSCATTNTAGSGIKVETIGDIDVQD